MLVLFFTSNINILSWITTGKMWKQQYMYSFFTFSKYFFYLLIYVWSKCQILKYKIGKTQHTSVHPNYYSQMFDCFIRTSHFFLLWQQNIDICYFKLLENCQMHFAELDYLWLVTIDNRHNRYNRQSCRYSKEGKAISY